MRASFFCFTSSRLLIVCPLSIYLYNFYFSTKYKLRVHVPTFQNPPHIPCFRKQETNSPAGLAHGTNFFRNGHRPNVSPVLKTLKPELSGLNLGDNEEIIQSFRIIFNRVSQSVKAQQIRNFLGHWHFNL